MANDSRVWFDDDDDDDMIEYKYHLFNNKTST